jgi:hypothetical protein
MTVNEAENKKARENQLISQAYNVNIKDMKTVT